MVIKFKKRNPDLAIIKSDKTKKVAVMTIDDYKAKMNDMLNDKDTFRECRKDPDPVGKIFKDLEKYINKLLKHKFIDEKIAKNLIDKHYAYPRIFGLVKLHKPERNLRPIVNGIKGPLYKVSKFLKSAFNKLREDKDWDVKNSIEAKEKLKNLKVEEGDIVVSYDVISLFTNIPLKLVYKIIEEEWLEIEPFTKIKNKYIFLEGIQLICENGVFKFNEKIFRQLFGVPMGGIL